MLQGFLWFNLSPSLHTSSSSDPTPHEKTWLASDVIFSEPPRIDCWATCAEKMEEGGPLESVDRNRMTMIRATGE